MGTMATLSRAGDTKIEWNPRNDAEVAVARLAFEEAIKPRSKGGQGMLAYRQGVRGARGEQIREFDHTAEKIVLAPQLVGG